MFSVGLAKRCWLGDTIGIHILELNFGVRLLCRRVCGRIELRVCSCRWGASLSFNSHHFFVKCRLGLDRLDLQSSLLNFFGIRTISNLFVHIFMHQLIKHVRFLEVAGTLVVEQTIFKFFTLKQSSTLPSSLKFVWNLLLMTDWWWGLHYRNISWKHTTSSWTSKRGAFLFQRRNHRHCSRTFAGHRTYPIVTKDPLKSNNPVPMLQTYSPIVFCVMQRTCRMISWESVTDDFLLNSSHLRVHFSLLLQANLNICQVFIRCVLIFNNFERTWSDVFLDLTERLLHFHVRKHLWDILVRFLKRYRGQGSRLEEKTVATKLFLLIRGAIIEFIKLWTSQLIDVSCPLQFRGTPNDIRKVDRLSKLQILVFTDRSWLCFTFYVHFKVQTLLSYFFCYDSFFYSALH